MTTEVLLKLLEAGYTKEEISLMEEVEKKPETAPVTEPKTDETEPKTDEPKTDETEPESSTMNAIGDIMKIIGKMQKTIDGLQKQNAEKAETKIEGRITADSVIKDFFAGRKKA